MATTKKQMQQRRESLRRHPMRDQIIDVMRSYGRPISPTQLSRIIDGTLGSTAYHVRTLVAAGVVELADEGRVRGAVEHFYALVDKDEQAQLTDPVGQLLGLCGALTVPAPDDGYPRPTVLDGPARAELQKLIAQLRPEVRSIVAAATQRTSG
jgi:DNA-binding transcriptional ArsR family regulator